jgi:hypothetical protein
VATRVKGNGGNVRRNLASWCKSANSRKNAAVGDKQIDVSSFSDKSLLGCNEFVCKIEC